MIEKRKVLIVDDILMNRQILTLLIEKECGEEIEIHSASGGYKAQEMILEHRYEVVLSDFEMPSGTGKELLQFAQLNKIKIPIVIFTGRLDLDTQDFLKLGAYKVILRDQDFVDELTLLLNTMLKVQKLGSQKH